MKTAVLIFLFTSIFIQPKIARGFGDNNLPIRLRGYVKAMPGLQLDKDFSDPGFNSLLHNRLNFRWDITPDLDLRVEGRNRLIYNDMFDKVPHVKDIFDQDEGLVDMSWVWLSDGNWIGHSELDRLYVNWRAENWRVRAGRQRINWGINLVSNPNDLFNVYSFFDFDYVERPGTDAIRVQHFLGGLSSVEVAVSPARNNEEMVAAAKYGLNFRGYDIQALGGYYRNRMAFGAGWAGNLREAGLKGEATWFYDLEETPGIQRGNLVAAIGLDYMFANGTFGVVEFLYNGGHERDPGQVFLITEPLRPDNIMFSKYALTLSADHSFSPIFSGSMAVMGLPDIEAAFFMPGFKYSVATNLDLEFISQIFVGGSGTIFEQAGSAYFLSLQYSF